MFGVVIAGEDQVEVRKGIPKSSTHLADAIIKRPRGILPDDLAVHGL